MAQATAPEKEDFWRLLRLAEDYPEAYRLEMDVRRWWELAENTSPIEYDWLKGTLRNYFGVSEPDAVGIMNRVEWLWKRRIKFVEGEGIAH